MVHGEIAAKAREVQPPNVERALVSLGERSARKGRGVVVLIDEVQAIPARPDLRAIVGALQTTRRRSVPVAAIITGLPSAPAHLIDAGTFTERMTKIPLGHLTRDATRLALLQPIVHNGAAITDQALDAATEASRGYPYFVQLYGYHCWRLAAGDTIEVTHVSAAGPAVAQDAAENIYQPRMARLSALEAAYVRAAAEHGERYVPTSAIVETLHRSHSQLGRTREALISEHNILTMERNGTVSFSVPGFATWLRDTTPLVLPAVRPPRPSAIVPPTDFHGAADAPDATEPPPSDSPDRFQPPWLRRPSPDQSTDNDLGI